MNKRITQIHAKDVKYRRKIQANRDQYGNKCGNRGKGQNAEIENKMRRTRESEWAVSKRQHSIKNYKHTE